MDKDVAIRKRTQIAKASRTMFIWVAGASVILGFALVGIMFLVQIIIFNERVLKEKDITIATLKTDNSNISELESQVRALDANQALIDSKAQPSDQAIQVILDALPSSVNSLALGASLQNKLLYGVDGLTVNSIRVDPVVGIESLEGGALPTDTSTLGDSSTSHQITFSLSISGSAIAIQKALQNLESSIRTIDVVSFKMDSQSGGDVLNLSIQARAFYEPERVVELKDKTVK